MASIRAKGKGFEARVRFDGKPISSSHKTLEDAKRWAVAVELGVISPKRDHSGDYLSLANALATYELEVVSQHKGARQERQRIRELCQLPLSDKALSAITPEDIRNFRDTELKRVTGSTVRLKMALLSAMFSHARREWGMNLTNPIADVKKPKANAPRTRRLMPGEEERLIAALKKCRNENVLPVVLFALETGMRKSEILRLTWGEIDCKKKIATLTDTKNGHNRWVPLNDRAISILTEQSNRTRPLPISSTALDQAWGHAVKRSGLLNLRFHDLRHEALSRWANLLDGNVYQLALISGHKSQTMLSRYIHVSQSEFLAGFSCNRKKS